MTTPRSHYDVLNVSPQAEGVVIEAAYKALMKKYHPDASDCAGPAPHDAAAINEAFSVLKDAARRAEYDHRLWSKQQAQRLIELKTGESRRASGLLGLGGWLVAGVLGCALAAVALGRSAVPPLAASALADAALPGESAAKAAAIKAAAAEAANDRLTLPSSASILARVRAEAAATGRPSQAARSVSKIRYMSAPRYRKVRKSRPLARAAREDKEFLEREGYIY